MTDQSAKLRTFFAKYVAERGGARDPRIEQAFASVRREPFAGAGPWNVPISGPWSSTERSGRKYLQTPDDDPAFLYQDVLIALDAARGINIGEPSLHAHLLDALAVAKGEGLLHVGSGSGYYTAILAHLVGPGGSIHAFEIDADLARRAKDNLAEFPWVQVQARSGIADDLPEVDAVYVNAGITHPSRTWLKALRPDGRLLFPLQPQNGFGGMLLAHRRHHDGASWPARFVCRAGFIGCEGPQDEDTSRRLAAAFARGDWQAVRSLRLDDKPDETCWCKGKDWWLSTQAAEPA